MILSKKKIEELVERIENFLKEHELLEDVCIYFNNKRHLWRFDYKNGGYIVKEENDINPMDYFSYVATNHILSMSFEGGLYHVLNGYTDNYTLEDKFMNLFEEYNLRYELGNTWNLTCYPDDDEMEIEYTIYEEPVQPTYLYLNNSNNKNIPPELKDIMLEWYRLSEAVGDKGSCVIGAGFNFTWKEKKYFMIPCSPWQGSLSWEKHISTVQEMLQNIGATDIHYKYGYLD